MHLFARSSEQDLHVGNPFKLSCYLKIDTPNVIAKGTYRCHIPKQPSCVRNFDIRRSSMGLNLCWTHVDSFFLLFSHTKIFTCKACKEKLYRLSGYVIVDIPHIDCERDLQQPFRHQRMASFVVPLKLGPRHLQTARSA